MKQDHLIDVNEAIDYLKQFAWVTDFDAVIERILDSKTIDGEQDDASL